MTTAVLHSRDDDGRLVVGVPLSNRPGVHAWLYATDYETIVNDHGSSSWFVNDNGKGHLYVRLRSRDRGNLVMVARLVTANPLVRRVRFRDGDPLNLRTRNLEAKAHPERWEEGRHAPRSRARTQAPRMSLDRLPKPTTRAEVSHAIQ